MVTFNVASLDGRIAIAAQAVGIAQAALEAAVQYAHEREVAGKPIMELQGVSFALADMAAQVDIARQYYIYAARLLEAGLPCMSLVFTDHAGAGTRSPT